MASKGLLDIVDELVLSCDIGYAKPDPRIYEVALDRIGILLGFDFFGSPD